MDDNMEKLAFGFGFGFGFNKRGGRYFPKCADNINEYGFEKIAEDNSDDKAKRIGLGVAGTTAIGSSKNMVLGKKRMYHGTSKANWEKIKNEGLRADRGGLGGASSHIGSDNYVKNSKNKVHATRSKRLANFYSNMNEVDSPYNHKMGRLKQKVMSYMKEGPNGPFISSTNPDYKDFKKANDEFEKFYKNNGKNIDGEFYKGFIRKAKNGKVIKINMDYDKYKSMEVDPDQAGKASKNKLLNKLQGNIASRGNVNVTPEEISGSSAKLKDKVKHTTKALPKYIKNNPLRFGAGVALASGGAYALGKAVKGKNKSRKEGDNMNRTAFDIVEDSFEKIASTNRRLSDEEKKELNKNVRGAQQSLNYRRHNPKSQLKNNLAGLGGAVIGAGLGYGAYKGIASTSGLKSAIKGAKLSKELANRKVFDSIEQYKEMSSMANKYKSIASRKKTLGNAALKGAKTDALLTGAGLTSGGIIGNALRDRSEVKKFMKERYGDDYKPTIRENEKQKILNRA